MNRGGISKIFKPSSVALFGASRRPGSIGTVLLRNLREGGFAGPLYPINPKYDEIDGLKAYRSPADVEAPVDLAVVAAPAAAAPEIFEQCGEQGVEAAIVVSAGFREAGPEGVELERRLTATARRWGIRFLGPNCLGVLRPDIGLNASFSAGSADPGRLALVSQSGALCTAILDWARPNGVGFSNVISTGIAADVDFGEILDYLVTDPETDAVMLYVEGLHDARRFMSALRAAARVKPVIVMKSGRHAAGSQAAVSHTGALVGSDDVFDAALRRAGAVRVDSFSAFFAAARTLNLGVRLAGKRVVVTTNGGGPAVMAADKLSERGMPPAQLSARTIERLNELLPAAWSRGNPVDVLGDADPERYAKALAICLEDPGVDGALAILTPQAMTEPERVAERVAEIAAGAPKPVFTTWMGEAIMGAARRVFRERRVPTYRTPEAAVESMAAVASHHENRQLLLQVPEPLEGSEPADVEGARMIIEGALAAHRKVLTAAESKAVLAAFRVPILQSLPAREPAEALLIAEEIGFPVALKINSPDVTHKSDVGGVRLNIRSARELSIAYQEMIAGVRRLRPEARIDGVFIEPMWTRGGARELLVGVTTDPVFGPVVSFGLGGTMVEVLQDAASALPPLNRYLAADLIRRTRAAAALGEFRGNPSVHRAALEDALTRVSEMVSELPEIVEMDVNPLLADEHGVLAVDARFVVRRVGAGAREYAHMAIHPYPVKLVRDVALPDGRTFRIRPVRPEDAVMERAFVDGLSDQTKYFRFMHALHQLTPEMLSRFTQIDYDREMALSAATGEPPSERQIGVARYVTLDDGKTCEFAVAIADEWQGQGVASQLLKDLIEWARDRRLARMQGVVLAENTHMLNFARNAGFKVVPDPDDRTVVNISLDL